MQLENELTVPLAVDSAWDLILDIERVAGCFPGASLDSFDGQVFRGNVSVKLGPIAMKYQGAGEFVAIDATKHEATIDAKGSEVNGAGGAGATVNLALTPSGLNATKISIQTDLDITGKPAQFGRGVIADVSDGYLKQFASNLEAMLDAGPGFEPSSAADINVLAATWRPVVRRVIPVAAAILIALAVLRSVRSTRPPGSRSVASGQ